MMFRRFSLTPLKTHPHICNKNAFSLAEVLITLTIIGVIAAITIPAIVQKLEDNQYKTLTKKSYSTLSQAFKLSYGYTFNDDYMSWDYAHSDSFSESVYDSISQHLNIIKVCGKVFENNECFPPAKAKNGKPALFFTENGFASNYAHLYTFNLNDGSSVAIDIWVKNSVSNYLGVINNLINESHNVVVLVDVNGFKKPNIVGRDVQMFVLTENGLVPAGIDDKSINCNNTNVSYNYDCTALILK